MFALLTASITDDEDDEEEKKEKEKEKACLQVYDRRILVGLFGLPCSYSSGNSAVCLS